MASVEERMTKSGKRWRVVWWEDGTRQQQTHLTSAAADEFRKRVEAYGNKWPPNERPVKPEAPPPVLTFSDWAKTAISGRSRASVGTVNGYYRDLDTYLKPTFGHLALDEITAVSITGWLDGLKEKNLSDKTIRNLHGLASSIMADALAHHPPLATHNPFARRLAKFAEVHTEEMVMLTPMEFGVVERLVRDEYRVLATFLAGTGMRYGEATALLVRDLNLLERKTVTVTKAWKRAGSAEYVVGEPKTPRSRRTISLPDELVQLLLPLVVARRGDELLFVNHYNQRIPHVEFYKRGWAPAVARARVCDMHYEPQRDGRNQRPRLPTACDCPGVLDKLPRIHDLRHSHASWLIAARVPLPAISRRLGHSSIAITIDRYGHLDPSLDVQVNAAVGDALAQRSEPGLAQQRHAEHPHQDPATQSEAHQGGARA